jgi:hypothetical protein
MMNVEVVAWATRETPGCACASKLSDGVSQR